MHLAWGKFSQDAPGWLKAGGIISAGVIALYFGAIRPINTTRGVAQQGATGLAAVSDATREPISQWREGTVSRVARVAADGIVGGVPGGAKPRRLMAYLQLADSQAGESADRKLIHTSALDLVVKGPTESAEQIRALAENAGGFLVSSQTAGGPDAATASLTIRIPVTRFEEVRAAIRKLSIRVEAEKLDAQDVTREYVDQEARLRNLRAEETQYLTILKRASTVKETLEVTGKLSEVRGEIEEQQAEFNALSKQVETVAITVSLHSEADVRVFGLNWRPLYQFKMSAREGVQALGDYAASMTAFAFYLPAVLLWLTTVLLGAAIGWRLLKWVARVFFSFPKTKVAEQGVS